jgi:hypothetical protein
MKLQKSKIKGLTGLSQSFKSATGKKLLLKDFLTESDWWELKKGKNVTYIVYHDAVKKIAKEAGISVTEYTILTQPSVDNNLTFVIQVKICDTAGKCSINLGEASRNNLGLRGRSNPANMAQKRAFDRAVFDHLGIVGVLGDDELPDKDEETMDNLTLDERKVIVLQINKILNSKNKKDLSAFNTEMKTKKPLLNENQLTYLRKLYKKKLAEFSKSF